MSGDKRDVIWHSHAITQIDRAHSMGQKPCVIWFTGLSGAGKSTVAGVLEARLFEAGYHTYLLDGDNIRHGLNSDLGFDEADRVENIRRIGEVSKLMVDAGLIVLTAFISPFRADRDAVRALLAPGQFIEVFVDTPLEVCEARDPKGLYKKARRGEIANFTGIDSAFEPPHAPEIHLQAGEASLSACVEQVLDHLTQQGHLLKGSA